MNEVSVVNFDAHGVRIPLGSNTVPHNSLMSLKSVETQLSDHVMWTKMRKVPSLASEKVLKVVASNTHVMALLENGDVYTWGNNLYGELGHGDLVRSDEPRVVKRLRGKQVRDISCGVGRSVALLAGNRAVYQWGMDFSFFPEPHPFWKSLPDEEVTKVIFQSQNGPGTPNTPQEWTSLPSVPREVASYGTFDPAHSSSSNAIWHSNIVLYLTDTGRVYIYGHDPHQIIFKMQKPILLDIFNNYPIMDAVIGSNFIAFLGEKGYVYTTGHNELGQRGTGLVGDCEMTIDAALNIPLSSSSGTHPHLPVDQPHSNNATTGKPSKGDMKNGSGSNAASWDGLNAAFERLSKSPYSKDPTNRGPWNSDPSIRREDDPSLLGAAPQRTLAQARRGHHDVGTPHERHASTGTRRSGGHQHSLFYDSHHSSLQNSHQRRAVEDEKLGHAMNTASIPSISTKVSFPETTQIAKISARGKKIYALATDGRVWHWGEGTYIPTIVEAVEQFIVVDLLAVPGGSAIFHTGPAPLPAPILTERGKARRKALGLEAPNCYNISARQMLWTPNGLKPYAEGAAIPPKCHLVVTVDWKRPPSSMIDRGEQIRWVTPGHDTIVGLQRNASEYSEPLLSLPQRQGTLVLDYLSPKVVRWSVDQGIASGQIDHHLEPLLQWAPLTDESRETLTRRRDRRAALVRSLLKDYQARMHAEARQLAEAKFAESRISIDSTASGKSSTTHGHGGMAMMTTSSGSAISNQQQPTQSSDRPPLPHAKSRQSLREVSSSGSLTSVHSALSISPVGTGQAASSSAKSQAAAAGGSSSVWDPSAAFIDIDSASTGIPASIDELNDSSLSSDFDPEEYAPMVPPGEYQAVYVITKPTFQILARSAPVKFTYEGIKASIDIESTTVVGDKPVTAHWKCEMKLGGIHIVARELESGKIVHSEALRQRTSDTIRWKLPAGSSYRIFIERTDVNGTTVLCESSVVEVVSGANPALSAFGNASMLAALSTMPSEVETCSEWSTFFKKCNLTPEFVVRYSSLLMAANISTTFIPALDSGILEKLGITNLQHQVQIMTTTMKYREAHVRAILTQELQKICDSCSSSDSQYPQSFSSSFHSQM
jgi:alpha-tubulin suppressor-like RCC1 family protein